MKNAPSDRELQILNILWRVKEASVRDVLNSINKATDSEVGYTTVLKLMQIMHEKGMLNRRKEGKIHLYSPALSEEENTEKTLKKLIKTTFRGSRSRLVMQLLGNDAPSREELNEIRAFLDQLDKNDKSQKKS